ncbi:AMP-binding protein [Porphyromonas circumdentaria]|uniref:Long-chain acyl-CoA synthetase n=1 Tax=Porphyromonas circumdentaria TaxID=29524 RepID=A0A1T4PQ89_9PORP|nr:AMP-binding protein [Porphyromonas circumdentaria]MBB6276450.1 long-chain acyl-CoA synthetase [Porphyromonas circumdentaria]SJZ93569.1 long-chain acyl-CoA synthetase [Porphyromonas circumdentaria]
METKTKFDINDNLIEAFETTFKECFSMPAFTDYDTGETFSYANVAQEIDRLHQQFSILGLKKGDKVALMGNDSARWCILFMATITYGAVIVPILQDFNLQDAERIIDHSDARILALDKRLREDIDVRKCPQVEMVLSLETLTPISVCQSDIEARLQALPRREEVAFGVQDIHFVERDNEEVMVINYTSGTTGNSKGVIITGQNLAGNALYAHRLDLMFRGDKILCFLPLAHTYSCAFNFLTPMTIGTHVTILGKVPSPKVILSAFAKVKPQLVITVPLILEKIYKQAIAPKLAQPSMKFLTRIPGLRSIVYNSINRRLRHVLGGEFREVIVGGAALSGEVAHFLKKIGFPLTVGYGMTECAPLICYENNRRWVPESCGKVLQNMELRIAREEGTAANTPGEIQVRGMNVCKGYYKNPEANAQLFTKDGWMHTGDLATMDAEGNVFIKGRSKTMILGSSGQNIYPEEIELKLNTFHLVAESLVVQRGKRLVALIYPDEEAIKKEGLTLEEGWKAIENFRSELNNQVAQYEKVTLFEQQKAPFEKTPKRSIKRFLYEEQQ